MADAPGQTELPKGSPEAPSQAPPSGVESQHKASTDLSRTATSSELAMLMVDMVGTLKTNDNFDFQGNFDSAEEFEKNAYFINIQRGLKEFLGSDKTVAPPQIKKAWIDACANFIIAEIESYNNASGAMGTQEVTLALDALKDPAKTGNSKQNGIGDFETWVTKSPHAAEYETWKADTEQTKTMQETQQSLQAKLDAIKKDPELATVIEFDRVKKGLERAQNRIGNPPKGTDANQEMENLKTMAVETKTAHEKAVSLETRLAAIPADIVPPALLEKVRGLKAKVEADDGGDLPELSDQLNAPELEKEIADLEAKAKKATETADTTAVDKADEEDVSVIGKAKAFLDKMWNSSWKERGTILLASITALVVSLVNIPWIGEKLRGTVISNEMLAKAGDQRAIIALRLEGEFKQFGLPRKIADEQGGRKTADVLKDIEEKPDNISKDPKVKDKLAWLGTQLKNKGGATNEQSLFEFMDPEGDWKKGVAVQYKESDTAVAANQPPAPPATPGVAPAVAPVVATAPAGPPAVPPPGAVATAPQPPPSVG